MDYSTCLFFGILPSVIWLLLYLRTDAHPESNRMVLKIFFYGMLIALPAVFIELLVVNLIGRLPFPPLYVSMLNLFLGVALVEEVLKYLVVREKVLDHHEFDEPLDTMLYMIIAALGFAASENILIFLNNRFSFFDPSLNISPWQSALYISAWRFVSGTFLHTLSSGILGYFLALSFYEQKNKTRFMALGLGISVLLHGLYNFSIINMEEPYKLLIPAIILFGLAFFVILGFNKLKKIKSVCKIN